MKKLFLALLGGAALAVAVHAEFKRLSRLGPANATLSGYNNSTTDSSQATVLAAGAAGVRNCFSKLSFVADSTMTVRVLDGGTTIYQVLNAPANTPVYEAWQNDDMCGTAATAMTVKVSTAVRAATLSTNQSVNYSGFTY